MTTIEQAKAVWQIGCRVFVGDDGCRHYAAMAAEIDKLIDAALAEAESRHALDKQKAVTDALAKAEERCLKHIDEVKEESDKWEEPWVGVVDEIHQEKVNHKAALAAERLRGEQAVKEALQELSDATNRFGGQRAEFEKRLAEQGLEIETLRTEHAEQVLNLQISLSDAIGQLQREKAEIEARVSLERRNWEAYREGEAGRIAKAAASAWEGAAQVCGRAGYGGGGYICEHSETYAQRLRAHASEIAAIAKAFPLSPRCLQTELPREGEKGRIEAAVREAYEDAAGIVETVENDRFSQRPGKGDMERNWFGGGADACEEAAAIIRDRITAKSSPTDSRTEAHDPPPDSKFTQPVSEASLYFSTAVGHFSGSCR